MASCPTAIGRPFCGGALTTRNGLEALVFPSDRPVSEPSRVLLPGFPVGEGQRSQGWPEGGAGSGGGAPQQLPRHAGSVYNPPGNGGVAFGEH